jgi:hypothetical protein
MAQVKYISDSEVAIEDRGHQLTMTPAQAASLGVALLTASVVCAGEPPKPESGTAIGNALLLVPRWDTGYNSISGEPTLVLSVAGGTKLGFQFSVESAIECGTSLANIGRDRKVTPPPKTN